MKCPICLILKQRRSNRIATCVSCENKNRPAAHPKKSKKRKEWHECSSTTKWSRRIRAKKALEEIGIPAWEVVPHLQPSQFIHLSTAERNTIRNALPQFHFPSERLFIQLKEEVATSHATQTSTTTISEQIIAYLTDPILFTQIIAQQSAFISIGIDKGNDTTKIGVSYEYDQKTRYAALLISTGKDNYDDLNALRNGLQFIGKSKNCRNIYQVLQHMIADERVNRKVFFHADWNCMNSILGLKSASSLYPCPICLVEKGKLHSSAPMRHRMVIGSKAQKHEPLLFIHPNRIVPLPLHIFLGLCNKIIRIVIPSIVSDDSSILAITAASVKTISLNPSSAGISRLHDMTGPELSRYIKSNQLMINTSSSSSSSSAADIHPHILQHWMEQLHHHLLHRERWQTQQEEAFSSFTRELIDNWESVTSTSLTPKCHMLLHVTSFVKQHHHLAKYGESQMESYHARFRYTEQHNHINQGRDTAERLRRTLADKSLLAVAPFLQQLSQH
jgi:hypothetical protein